MKKEELRAYQETMRKELLENVIPFWMDHGMLDKEYGGCMTGMDREGNIYTTDKMGWFQGRCGYIWSWLCLRYGKRDEWLEIPESAIKFADECCTDPEDGRMYFMVTREGKRIRKRRYTSSEVFYIMACAEYYAVTKDVKYLEKARKCYNFINGLLRGTVTDPFQPYPKYDPEVRPMRGYPMIMVNIANLMSEIDVERKDQYLEDCKFFCEDTLKYNFKPELKALLECVAPDGTFIDADPLTREVNPGHAIETSWFMMEFAHKTGNKDIMEKALQIFEWAFEMGWDKKYGGIRYFVDVVGKPVEKLDAELKLWWPQTEAIIASLVAYKATGDEKYLDRFKMVTDYMFKYYPDREHGEWYGYLWPDNSVYKTQKGWPWKGPFHLPRMLIKCDELIDEILK